MSDLERRFREDRRIRDIAKRNLMADIAQTRAGLSGSSIASRVAGRVSEGARDVFETAKQQADDNRGIVAALIGALVLWLGRGPLLDLLGLSGGEEDEPEGQVPRDPAARYAYETKEYPHEFPGDHDEYRN